MIGYSSILRNSVQAFPGGERTGQTFLKRDRKLNVYVKIYVISGHCVVVRGLVGCAPNDPSHMTSVFLIVGPLVWYQVRRRRREEKEGGWWLS